MSCLVAVIVGLSSLLVRLTLALREAEGIFLSMAAAGTDYMSNGLAAADCFRV